VVTTGTISSEARKYANKIMTDTNLNIVMIEKDDIQGIIGNPSFIVNVFNREANKAMKLKILVI
jgi:hypothetical protein